MKSHICCCAVEGTLGVVRNLDNTAGARPPELLMGLPCELRLRLFANCEDTTPYPPAQLADVVSWSFAMDNDFSPQSAVKLVAENADIALSEVTENGVVYTQIAIPIPETHTTELAAALDGRESVVLAGELTGYDRDRAEVFVLQIKGFVVRGRLAGLGDSLSVVSAVCEAMAEESVNTFLASGSYVVSSGAELIASGAVVNVLSGGGYVSGGDVSSAINASALPKNAPFSTTVGGYTVELTSNGGFSVYGSGASVTLSGGAVAVSASEGIVVDYNNDDLSASAYVSVGYNGVSIAHDIEGSSAVFDISGSAGITANGSAITQVSSGVSDTSLEIDELLGGVKYICSSALSALSIGSAGSGCNVAIFFTVASGAIVTPPANVPYFGVTSYTAGSSYCMMVNGDAAVCNEAAIVPGV